MLKKILLFLFILSLTSVLSAAVNTTPYLVNTNALKVRLAPTKSATHSYSIYRNQKVNVYEIKNNWARLSPYKTTKRNGIVFEAAKWTYSKYLRKISAKIPKKVIIKQEVVEEKIVQEEPKVEKKDTTTCTSCAAKKRKVIREAKAQREANAVREARITREALRKALREAKKAMAEKEAKAAKAAEVLKKENEAKAAKKAKIATQNLLSKQDNFQEDTDNSELADIISKSDNFRKHAYVFMLAAEQLIENGVCTVQDFNRMRGWVATTPENTYFSYCGGYKRKNKIYIDAKTGVMHR